MGRCSAHTLSLPAGHRTEVSEVDRSPGRTIHPLHAVLLAGTVPLFLGTVLSDCACSKSDEVQWLNFSSWLIIGGLAFCGLTFCGLALLWAVVNERDEIGLNLVPDYLTSVREGGFYDWPYSYWGQNVDVRAQPQDPQQVAAAISPDYSLGSHVAALGVERLPHTRGLETVPLTIWLELLALGDLFDLQAVGLRLRGGEPDHGLEAVLTALGEAHDLFPIMSTISIDIREIV